MGRQSARIYFQGKDHKEIYFNGHYHDQMYLTDSEGKATLVWEKIKDYRIIKRCPLLYSFLDGMYYIVFQKWGKNEKDKDYTSMGYYICESADLNTFSREYYIFDEAVSQTLAEYNMFISDGNINLILFDYLDCYGYSYPKADISGKIQSGINCAYGQKRVVNRTTESGTVQSRRLSVILLGSCVAFRNSKTIKIKNGLNVTLKEFPVTFVSDGRIISANAGSDNIILCNNGRIGLFGIDQKSSEDVPKVFLEFDADGNYVEGRSAPKIEDAELENDFLNAAYTALYEVPGEYPEILGIYCDPAAPYVAGDGEIVSYSDKFYVKVKYFAKRDFEWHTTVREWVSDKKGCRMIATKDSIQYVLYSHSEFEQDVVFMNYDWFLNRLYIDELHDYAYIKYGINSASNYVLTIRIGAAEYSYDCGRLLRPNVRNLFYNGEDIVMARLGSSSSPIILGEWNFSGDGILIFNIKNRNFHLKNVELKEE